MKYINKIEIQGEVVSKIINKEDDTVIIGVRIPTGKETYDIHYCNIQLNKINDNPIRMMSCVHVTGSLNYLFTGMRIEQAIINVDEIMIVENE